MGLISRHAGEPYADGEVLDAGTADAPDGLELDVSRFYAEFNGGISNVNFAASDADLAGTQIAVASITGAKFATSAVTAAKLLDESVPNAKFADAAITAVKFEANALTRSAENTDDALSVAYDTDFQDVLSQAVLTGDGVVQRVLVMWAVRVTAPSFGDSATNQQLRLRRNNVVLWTSQLNRYRVDTNTVGQTDVTTNTGMWLDTGAPQNASVVYDLQISASANDADETVESASLTLLNLRR